MYFPHYYLCVVSGNFLKKFTQEQYSKDNNEKVTYHIICILEISLINLKLISHHHDSNIREFRQRRFYHTTTHVIKKKFEVRRGQKID